MAGLIREAGCAEFVPHASGLFEVLVRGIAGQQLSGRAAEAIFERLRSRVGVTPDSLAGASDDALRGAGLSRAKAGYVRGLAHAVACGELDLERLRAATDDEAVAELTRIRGVGRWTAEMFLLFALGRPDVLPADDLGVRASAGAVLGLGRAATRDELLAAGEAWRPYRSAATLYLWRHGRGPAAMCAEVSADGEGGLP